jgi:ketosteroid isomerase-like protein
MSHLKPEKKAALDAALARYVAALGALDEKKFLACFRSNCVVRDPYGVSIYEGADGLRQLFATLADTWQSYTVRPGQVYYGGSERIVFTWEVEATARNGKAARFGGISVMTLEKELIDGLEAYWDAPAMFDQIKD